ncbi:MAG: hypothetical protein QM532_00745 [Cyanobium sp. MAG06]|nr:hypothetical protein [Cyanobium sp. MAG06]
MSIREIYQFINKRIKQLKIIAFIGGFILDLLFLPNITSKFYLYIAPVYIGIILLIISVRQVFLYLEDEYNRKDLENQTFYKINRILTLIISFFLGSLLSYILVYYLRSAEIVFSLQMFFILLISIILNEVVGAVFFDIILFFTGITFYVIYNTPILVGYVSEKSFILSLFLAFLVMFAISYLLKFLKMKTYQVLLLYLFSILFPIILYVLYNIGSIPAVPLSLNDDGFYSRVEKSNPEYIREENGKVNYKKYYVLNKYYYDHRYLDNGLYFYAAIVSPTDVSARVQHI